MPDALDNLLADIDGAARAARQNLTLGRVRALNADGRRATIEGLDKGWIREARLYQPRLMMAPAHSHAAPAADTGQASNHAHSVPSHEVSEAPPHTHAIEYRVGDVGLLLRLGGQVSVFLGGL